jgi:hypothetical protein
MLSSSPDFSALIGRALECIGENLQYRVVTWTANFRFIISNLVRSSKSVFEELPDLAFAPGSGRG